MLFIATDGCVAGTIGHFLAQHGWPFASSTLAALLALTTVASFSSLGAYTHVLRHPLSWHRYCAAFASFMCGSALLLLAWGAHEKMTVSEFLLAVMLVFTGLFSLRVLLCYSHRWLCPTRSLWVIAEDAASARELASKVRASESRYQVKRSSGLPSTEDIAADLESLDAVLCPADVRESMEGICRSAGKELLVVPSTSQLLLHSASSQLFDDLLVLSLPSLRPRPTVLFAKRMLDIVLGLLLFTLTLPVMALLYLAIVAESSGGALFRQERRGLNGESFLMLKFRSMVRGAERSSGPVLASDDDPRVTPLGRVLRATRLDELPQLWNVVRGDMSLVGPRPEREFFARKFDKDLPDYPQRTWVKPGLTGLAQVWGNYTTSAEDKLRLDLLYIANLSLAMDIRLLLQTAGAVLRPGAARGTSRGLDCHPVVSSRSVSARHLQG